MISIETMWLVGTGAFVCVIIFVMALFLHAKRQAVKERAVRDVDNPEERE